MKFNKFRAIDVSTGQLLLFPAYFDIDNDGIVFRTSLDPEREVVAVMYTGLKDKKGVEIYEGDVIRHLNGTIWTDPRVVSWGTLEDSEYGKMGVGFDLFWADIPVEVIGNIYENPELLEQTNE